MTPQGRAVLVLSLLVMFLWAAHVVWSILTGPAFDAALYMRGLLVVCGGVLAGFGMVWAAALLGNLRRNLATGFEAGVTDEYGTAFVTFDAKGQEIPFPLSLSKFLPQMVAPPDWPGLHPLEAELIGFLQGYRHWPVDIAMQNKHHEASPGREFASLYERAVARWQMMRQMPAATPWHRIAALAKDLALVHAFEEKRSTRPFLAFWQRDTVTFRQRSQAHGGMSAFILSTFPAFRNLKTTAEGRDMQRTLLVALRYHSTPHQLPLSSSPLAREIVDYLWRTEAQLQQLNVQEVDQMSAEQLEALRHNMTEQWVTILADMEPAAELTPETACLKMADGSVWIRQDELLHKLAMRLKPNLRQALSLWDSDGGLHHPAWPHLANLLQENSLVAKDHDGQMASNACFTLVVQGVAWGPVMKILAENGGGTDVLRRWAGLPSAAEAPEVVMDTQQLAAHSHVQAGLVDAKLAELF